MYLMLLETFSRETLILLSADDETTCKVGFGTTEIQRFANTVESKRAESL